MSIVNGTITTNGDYGISIADLQSAFGSARVDLMCLHVEDNGVPDTGADTYDELLDSDSTSVLKSAFALSDIALDGGTRSNAMPLPSGMSLKSYGTPSQYYRKGDLILGRHPKWKLWADGINVGKKIEDRIYYYNLFKTPMTTNDSALPCLQQWQDYNESNVHEPSYSIANSEVTIEFHNGQFRKCLQSEAFYWGGSSPTVRDDRLCYPINENENIGSCTFALGNLVDWWRETPYSQLLVSGGLVTVKCPYGQTTLKVAQAFKNSSSYLNKNTSDKADYRDGVTIQLDGNSANASDLLAALTPSPQSVSGTAEFELYQAPGDTIPQSNSEVDLHYIIPAKTVTIKGNIDTKANSSATKFRCFLTDIDSTKGLPKWNNYYVIPAAAGSDGMSMRYEDQSSSNHNGGFFFDFWLSDGSTIDAHGGNSFTFKAVFHTEGATDITKTVTAYRYSTTGSYGRKGAETIVQELSNTVIPSGCGTRPTDYTKGYVAWLTNEDIYGTASNNIPEATSVTLSEV